MTARVALHGDQLIATRYLEANSRLVWKAFTDPEHLAQFWGGDHATILPGSVSVDLRVGGAFALETLGSDGCSYPLRFRYEEVEPLTRLVLSEPLTGLMTEIRLEPTGTGTTVTIHQRRLPLDLRTEKARTGLAGILDRLDAVIEEINREGRTRAP
jgi:uncharacterized protein YndB with AHSA1/START domain